MQGFKQVQAKEAVEEGVFLHWADLPLVLQHAVGTASLRYQQQEDDVQSWYAMSCVRLGCRPLRDGVDAARTRLTVMLDVPKGAESRLQMLPMAVDAARFRGLRRLDLRLHGDGAGSAVHLEGPPTWLQELHISFTDQIKLLSLPPGASMPQLHALALHMLRGALGHPTMFDCSQFAGLQRLVLTYCLDIKHLAHLDSCPSLRVLEIETCLHLVSGLEPGTLSQLCQLEQLQLVRTSIKQLDVPSLSPSLTHLDVSSLGTVDLALPGGAPRTALRHLQLCAVTQLQGLDLSAAPNLSAVPNLETLDISHKLQLPPVLDLSGVPHLKHLNTAYAQLQALDLSAVRSSLVSLDVSHTPLCVLDLTGCAALAHLDCSKMRQLRTLDLTPVAASLTWLDASKCDQLTFLNLVGCTALQELDVSCSSALTQLDLSDCVSLKKLSITQSRVREVDVSSCTALMKMCHHEGQRVVGAGPGVQLKAVRPS